MERLGPSHVADLVVGPPYQEDMIRVLERPWRKALGDRAGLVDLALAQQSVEFQQQRIDDLVVGFGELEGLIAHADRLVELGERVDVQLRRVQHRLEVGVVERDGLAVVVDRLLELTLQGSHVAEQVVGLGRLAVDFERSPRRNLGASWVTPLNEVPTAVEMRRELVHGSRTCGPDEGSLSNPSDGEPRGVADRPEIDAHAGRPVCSVHSWMTTRVPRSCSVAHEPWKPAGITGVTK